MITRHIVPMEQRVRHTADLFGGRFPMILGPVIYVFASHLSPDYRGGYWQFYDLSNGGFYMAPDEAAHTPWSARPVSREICRQMPWGLQPAYMPIAIYGSVMMKR